VRNIQHCFLLVVLLLFYFSVALCAITVKWKAESEKESETIWANSLIVA